MFRNDSHEDSNFWISYADLMAGLLFVFILLIGAIVSKSIILKSDLNEKASRLSTISESLKDKEQRLDEARDTLAKSKVLISEKDERLAESNAHLTENERILLEKENLLTLKNARIAEDEKRLNENSERLSESEKLIQLKNARIAKDQMKLSDSERMFKLKISEIEKLNKLLLAANAREAQLSDKIIIVQDMLDENKNNLQNREDLLEKNKKALKDYEGKVMILSKDLSQSKEKVKITDEKLLTLLNAMDEKKTKYDALVANLQSQKAKIKSLTGIKLKVVAALKQALGENIDIDKKTGSLKLASNILFEVGQASLKDEAKVELKKAFEQYIGTLVKDKAIKPHLDKIIIEGHTDSDGSYIYNLNLSQKRALAVMEYLLTLDFTRQHNIQSLMAASGRAYLDAIKVNGVEDKDASRRIEIKFTLRNEDAMSEIEKVLDAE